MQSLEARKKDRKKRAAENRKEAEERGIATSGSGSNEQSNFDAKAFLSGSVADVTNGLSDLSDEQFEAVADYGDERAGVKSAIEADRKRREKRGDTSWTPNS